MTSEIVEFKCPSCGHKLAEEEYWHVCQIQKSQMEQIVENEVTQRTSQIEQSYVSKMRRLEEEHTKERAKTEQQIETAVSKIVNEEKLRMEKQYCEKVKQLDTQQAENDRLVDEKISQAIIQNEAKHRQEIKESELKYSRLLDKVGKLETALNMIPPELRGTAGELVLQDELQKEFKTDTFASKIVGVEMADVVQTIVTENGEKLLTPIAYDKKMGIIVTRLDIDKAKRYKTIHNTDHVIIVTAKGIRNNQFTEKREGIVLVHPIVLLDVARMIRYMIIETAKYAKNSEELRKAEARIYDYVTSPQYNREWEIILDFRSQLDDLQLSDDRRQKQTSEKRTKLVDRLYELINKNHSIIGDILDLYEK